ncbi:MAG: mycofactocin system GMC family oxidoreductase MftG [Mycobacterium sp.]|nr:mycofactocin system GMC family oxidoreductase MftG [Mycobacterium sp.]
MTDVLIVGSGSAGSVLAERLSTDRSCRVTVVEAGPGLDDPKVRALTEDGLALPIGPASPVVRRFDTRLTEHPPRSAELVRGACFGGSGAINGGYFCRASPADFEALGWSWAEVVEHYQAVEDRIGPAATDAFSRVTAEFVHDAQAAGYRWLPDLNAAPVGANAPPGIAAVPLNIIEGRRRGPGSVFLKSALDRPNLSVLTGTRVTRVRTASGRAVGVDAIGPAGPLRLSADRVVLSAGALGSAQLLLLSGIGPASELCALGIPVVADLPVGLRSWDHPEWLLPTDRQSAGGCPVLEVVLVTDELEIRAYTTGFGGRPKIGVALMRPRSRGRVSLVSADPLARLRIEHRYDSESADLTALRAGVGIVDEMLCGAGALGTPDWSTSQHLCGTAPMGRGEGAVVDPRCRVIGVSGLWVVDGSVLPTPLSRGPHATIAMVGHRAAEFV